LAVEVWHEAELGIDHLGGDLDRIFTMIPGNTIASRAVQPRLPLLCQHPLHLTGWRIHVRREQVQPDPRPIDRTPPPAESPRTLPYHDSRMQIHSPTCSNRLAASPPCPQTTTSSLCPSAPGPAGHPTSQIAQDCCFSGAELLLDLLENTLVVQLSIVVVQFANQVSVF